MHNHIVHICVTFYDVLIPGDSEQRLCKGINYLKEGSDPPLLADSEYPEWLWSILDDKKKPKADEESPVDINNKTLWRRKRKLKIREQNAMRAK